MEAATRRVFPGGSTAMAMPVAATTAATALAAPGAGLLAHKNAVIYGAAGAIGSTVARAFAREGAQVFLAGRTLKKLSALEQEIVAFGGRAQCSMVDAMDARAVGEHLAALVQTQGAIDISFNLIGIHDEQGKPLGDLDVESFSRPIANAMRTQFITATAAAKHMSQRRCGVILALTAQVARKPYSGSGGFGVASAAIEGLWRQLAVEFGPAGLRLVTLRSSGSPDAPGVSTAIAEHARLAGVSREVFEARIAEKTMLRRMPRMAEVANTAVLMASDRASAITAAVTNVTCGELAD